MNHTESFRNFFVVVTILIIGAINVIKIRTIDVHFLMATFAVMFPAAIVMGLLGQKIGEIVDNPKNREDADYKLAVLNALKKMDKSITLQEINDKLTKTVAEPDLPDEPSEEDI